MNITQIRISIGNFIFDYCNSVTVESSWKNFTDTCKIVLPLNIKPAGNQKFDKNNLRDVIKVGDPVLVQAGYNHLNQVFKGYVTSLSPKIPIEISCEDEMWRLKQNSITDSLQNVKLSNVLSKHFPNYNTKILDLYLGNFQINKASQAKILQSIKDQFVYPSFFRQDVLTVGLTYDPETATNHKFNLSNQGFFDGLIVDNNLIYKRKEDVRIKVKAISNMPSGNKIELELGDEDGEQRTLNFYNLTEGQLRPIAEKEMGKLKYDGYTGDFTTFFAPFVRHGDIVEILNPDKTDQTGKFWVDKVVYDMGMSGFRQKISLGPKA